jgi:hypothetical protein
MMKTIWVGFSSHLRSRVVICGHRYTSTITTLARKFANQLHDLDESQHTNADQHN